MLAPFVKCACGHSWSPIQPFGSLPTYSTACPECGVVAARAAQQAPSGALPPQTSAPPVFAFGGAALWLGEVSRWVYGLPHVSLSVWRLWLGV
jgi:hypothetical protein